MARPTKCRRICTEPAYDQFLPGGIASGETIVLTLDEYEAIRLIDLEKCTHAQCAEQMDISRTTVTELYETARYKIADSIVNGKPLQIAGGNYRLCDGTASFCCHRTCTPPQSTDLPAVTLPAKGANTMRIAVTYENGQIFQHFGHTQQFKVYDIENGQITNTEVLD